jgi:hypothetical protein
MDALAAAKKAQTKVRDPPPKLTVRTDEFGNKTTKDPLFPPGFPEDQFVVYRNDELDPFKPHSEAAVDSMASRPIAAAMDEKEARLLHSAAVTFDRSLSIERVVTFPERIGLPDDVIIELQRMPNWLSAIIEARFPLIQSYYKGETLSFLRSINHKIDREFRPEFAFFEGSMSPENLLADQDERDTNKLQNFAMVDGAVAKEPDVFHKSGANIVFRVTEASESTFSNFT